MNKINRKVEYALIALKHMHEKFPGELTSAKEVSDNYKAPFDVISRVMQTLAQKEILKSVQGAHGGYQIFTDLSRVTLHDLVEFILGPIEIAKCLHDTDSNCELLPTCNIVSPISNLNEKLIEFYKSLSVRDLISEHPRMISKKVEGGQS